MNAGCLLMKTIATSGPSPVSLRQCCVAALIAQHDPDEPDGIWLCPIEEHENDLVAPWPS
jgi:hypothetical protein